MVIAPTWLLVPQLDVLRNASEILCDGNKGFVYGLDPNFIVYQTKSNPYNIAPEHFFNYPHVTAVDELINGVIYNNSAVMSLEFPGATVDAVKQTIAWDTAAAADALQDIFGVKCLDVLNPTTKGMLRFINEGMPIAEAAGLIDAGPEVTTCEDVRHMCSSSWSLMKVVCPETCGCSDPNGTVFLATPEDSCPSSCMTSQRWRANLSSMPCEDAPSAIFSRWIREMEQKLDRVFAGQPHWKAAVCGERPCGELLERGCGIVEYWPIVMQRMGGDYNPRNVCDGNWLGQALQTRPLAPICPLACGCNATSGAISPYCPDKCQSAGTTR